jgi:hypothetical protein
VEAVMVTSTLARQALMEASTLVVGASMLAQALMEALMDRSGSSHTHTGVE